MRRTIVATTAALAALAGAGSARAAVTVGSDLARTAAPEWCTGDGPGSSCTELQITIGRADQAVPIDGVIVRWAVRDAGGHIGLRVLDGPAGARRVVAAGPTVLVPGPGIQGFASNLPVRAGQRIGVQLETDAQVPFAYVDEVTLGEQYLPELGEIPAPPNADAALTRTYELLFNATIEPDADRDGLGDETQDPDRGGAPAGTPPAGGPPPGAPPASGPVCSTRGAVLTAGEAVVRRSGRRYSACLAGRSFTLGTTGGRQKVALSLFRIAGTRLALVRVRRGVSAIEVHDLAAGRRTFSTTRVRGGGGAAADWRVRDLVVAPGGDAAWISTRRGHPGETTVFVRHGRRVQPIDTGRIRPTSLTITAAGDGIDYRYANGRNGNSTFG
jgi:hypothetical protein